MEFLLVKMMKIVTFMLELLRVLLTVTRPYCYTVLDIIYRIIFGARVTLPPIKDKLLLIPATVLAEKIRKRKLKAGDVMKAYIKRIEEVDRFVNACVDQRFDDALRDAEEVDLFLSNTTKSEEEIARNTPLLGVPFSCKEALGVKGLAQTSGLVCARNRKAPEDSDVAALYRKAGAIPLVVTNVSEFCIWWDAANVSFGRTFNPYDKLRSAGGSSGGEAALIACAGSLMGAGNDLHGSIRVPAAFNGVYAHNPSTGTISNEGFWILDNSKIQDLVGTGPICRYAQDLPTIAYTLSNGKIRFDRKMDFGKIKIYYMEKFPGYLLEPTPDVKAAVRKAAKYFEETYDNKPIQIDIPELKYTMQMTSSKFHERCDRFLIDALDKTHRDINLLSEFIKIIFRCSEHTLPTIYIATMERAGADDRECRNFIAMFDVLKQKMDRVMEGDSLLLVPTHPEPALHHFMALAKVSNKAYTSVFNFLGYPTTQIPAGLSGGLPIGILAASYVNNDHVCISAAIELEKLFGGWVSPSKFIVS